MKITRQYSPAYRAENGNVIPIGSSTVSAEFAEREAESYRSPDDETEVFVAYRDLPSWEPMPKAPTFGEIYEQLKTLKDAGVTLESLMWVAKEKVWWE